MGGALLNFQSLVKLGLFLSYQRSDRKHPMKKTIFVVRILLLCLLICGCPPKMVTVKTDRFEALFTDGLKYEAQKEWQKAQAAFQSAISATSDIQQRQSAQERLADVKKQLRMQALYEKFVDYQKHELSDKMRQTLSEAHLIAPDNPYVAAPNAKNL